MGGLAFGALGVAIGGVAREVSAASLLAFLLSLPVAFIALVPASAVSGALKSVLDAIAFVFPFRAALQAIEQRVQRYLTRDRLAARAPRGADGRVLGARTGRPASLRVTADRQPSEPLPAGLGKSSSKETVAICAFRDHVRCRP